MTRSGNSTEKVGVVRCGLCKSLLSFTMCQTLLVWFQAEEKQLNNEQKLRSKGAETWHIYKVTRLNFAIDLTGFKSDGFYFLPEEKGLMRLGSKARFCFLESYQFKCWMKWSHCWIKTEWCKYDTSTISCSIKMWISANLTGFVLVLEERKNQGSNNAC